MVNFDFLTVSSHNTENWEEPTWETNFCLSFLWIHQAALTFTIALETMETLYNCFKQSIKNNQQYKSIERGLGYKPGTKNSESNDLATN